MKKNLLVFFGALFIPLLILAQTGTDTFHVNQDTLYSRNPNTIPVRGRDSGRGLPPGRLIQVAGSQGTVHGFIPGNSRLLFFQQVLSQHPYFNFFGKPLQLVIHEKKGGGSEPFFYLLLLLFFYYALIRLSFSKYLGDLFTLFFRATLRQQQLREQLLQSPLPSLLLNALFVLSSSLYSTMLLRHYQILEATDFWVLWFYCLMLLVSVYTVKFLVLKTIGWVLRIRRASDIYLFVVFMVNKMAGIFLLPVLLLMAFPEPHLLPVVIPLSLFVLAFLLGYRIIVSFKLIRTEIKLNLFHFFLYLCAFEIAPLLLIYKVLLKFVERTY